MFSKKSNTLSYMITNGSKSPSNWFPRHFDPVPRVSDLSDGLQFLQFFNDDFS